MNIGRYNPMNTYNYRARPEGQNRLSRREKIKAEPTEEQLKFIEEEMAREAEYLKGNDQIVAIDWDYIKETINLSDEDRKLRELQDSQELKERHKAEMDAIDAEYNAAMAKIDANAEVNSKKEDEANKAKANMIVAQIARGIEVSPFDRAFALDVFPEKVKKAMEIARELKEQNKDYGLYTAINQHFIDIKA